ncbi:hypothetical protein MJO29_011913 [Puccinia striiformis f. sp. tritici]|uniref:Uncharacterized protein n=1 Tax=Puccinia striiformis f. sp. tritici PST-78 TaxID=1165861 RepID=A0A0L0VQH7_9BASI|nr:hypothetical protein Pst134EA_022591 [Puccinia striiformis f. sp. tritici]KAH9455115.1 hypothetical protein Pst134EA_022591 [Puccinia striiformis f. sp. tritici]KAI7945525.1 hypothetical protein MJO29_011913 [Puccinia striiformis f. sp. tritici]KAI9605753.1 hypothetical protein H4Q26_004118 [Puccinia striiformis f. sp. tritici PST-130]KNF01533.1 hypothetical protein PSTG_05313 [Puccinia striiformis f. sp. tritici PST-78]
MRRTSVHLDQDLVAKELDRSPTSSITTKLPICFLMHFDDCTNIESIELDINKPISAADIRKILRPNTSTTINSSFWPRLEQLIIATGAHSNLSSSQLQALRSLCLKKGVVLRINDDADDEWEDDARFGFSLY